MSRVFQRNENYALMLHVGKEIMQGFNLALRRPMNASTIHHAAPFIASSNPFQSSFKYYGFGLILRVEIEFPAKSLVPVGKLRLYRPYVNDHGIQQLAICRFATQVTINSTTLAFDKLGNIVFESGVNYNGGFVVEQRDLAKVVFESILHSIERQEVGFLVSFPSDLEGL